MSSCTDEVLETARVATGTDKILNKTAKPRIVLKTFFTPLEITIILFSPKEIKIQFLTGFHFLKLFLCS